MGDLQRNFNRSEFACKCGCGKDDIKQAIVDIAQELRDEMNIKGNNQYEYKISIRSGCRCEEHNKNERGRSNSAHLRGTAIDIACTDGRYRFLLMGILFTKFRNKIKRIGVARTFIHIDIDGSLPQEVTWVY